MTDERPEVDGNHWGDELDDVDGKNDFFVDTEEGTEQSSIKQFLQVGVFIVIAISSIVFIAMAFGAAMDAASDASESKPEVIVETETANNSIIVSISNIPSSYSSVTISGPSQETKTQTPRTVVFENPPDTASIQVTGVREMSSGMYGGSGKETVLVYSNEIDVSGEGSTV